MKTIITINVQKAEVGHTKEGMPGGLVPVATKNASVVVDADIFDELDTLMRQVTNLGKPASKEGG